MRLPRLMAISDRRRLGEDRFSSWLVALAEAGVDAVQVREKELDDRELYRLVSQAVEIMGGSKVVVNGRADVALAAGAGGVHLPSNGAPIAQIRRLVGPGLLLGYSTHSIAEIDSAAAAGADYVTFSPIYDTPGKSAVGVAALERAVVRGLPVIALGGITIDRLNDVAGAGACGAAAIRMFADLGKLAATVAAGDEAFGP